MEKYRHWSSVNLLYLGNGKNITPLMRWKRCQLAVRSLRTNVMTAVPGVDIVLLNQAQVSTTGTLPVDRQVQIQAEQTAMGNF
jgi:hypothetical protein